VNFLNPFLDPLTRTLKARMNIENQGLELKLDMLGTALLHYGIGEKLAVPEQAVLRTGTRSYAFKAGDEDHLLPVTVTLGMKAEGYFELLSGLQEGDRVATSANFLIDSESSLKAALRAVTGDGHDPAAH
jgi:Cu(I)/Ag(I) efflux system membrane fusion protein